MNDLIIWLSAFGIAARPLFIRARELTWPRTLKYNRPASEEPFHTGSTDERSELLNEIRRITSVLEGDRRGAPTMDTVHPGIGADS